MIGLYDFMIFYDEIYVNAKIEGLGLYVYMVRTSKIVSEEGNRLTSYQL
jgi:hypothetical protein